MLMELEISEQVFKKKTLKNQI